MCYSAIFGGGGGSKTMKMRYVIILLFLDLLMLPDDARVRCLYFIIPNLNLPIQQNNHPKQGQNSYRGFPYHSEGSPLL